MHWHDQQGTVHRPTTLVLVSLGAAVGLGLCLGWKSLGPRLGQIEEDYAIRQQLYEMGKRMAADYAWFGTGPGTFESVFQFYRPTSESAWPAQLHNDWLETRITFGRFGCCLLLLAFGVVLLGACVGKGKSGVGTLTPFIGLAMAGVLVHARFDFPFQVLSIEFLFVVLCAVLFSGVHDPAPVYGAGNAHRKPMLLAR